MMMMMMMMFLIFETNTSVAVLDISKDLLTRFPRKMIKKFMLMQNKNLDDDDNGDDYHHDDH